LPPRSTAGQHLKVTATLDSAATETLTITFEKHRVDVDQSGVRALCVILQGCFADNAFPNPIEVKATDTTGSTTVRVSEKAENPTCHPPDGDPPSGPIVFPDRLMLTAFVMRKSTQELIGKEHLVVTILGQGQGPPPPR
jgi:hypothetical protein